MKEEKLVQLFQHIQKENLYVQTIKQLNKDLQLANIDKYIDETLEPVALKTVFSNFILDLLANNYDGYLNLIYRVDVSETELKKISSKKLEKIAEEISFLILKREFQKVWLKKRFSK